MPERRPPTDDPEWRADFRAAEERAFEASLAATPSQRLAWLEQALAFAYKVGALKGADLSDGQTSLHTRHQVQTDSPS